MAIQILDSQTINQIAAGEVIERPASALKELLENSSDAGATRIEVDFDLGGKRELKVIDDGDGIDSGELGLALARHGTSKIKTIDDVTEVSTFGFRGEALSSIAAVSDLTLISHCKKSDLGLGAKISARGGQLSKVEPLSAPFGTQVIMRDLFFNVPARQKFLKSDAGETAAIKKVVKAFAMAHPELSIVLRQGGKVIQMWEKESFHSRACRTLNVAQIDTLLIKKTEGAFTMEAVLVLPHLNLSTQAGLWVFVQNRPVADRTITQSVLEGYRNLVMGHQYPQAVISLQVLGGDVDVNVHPTKAQVKFVNPSTVFRFVSHSIKEALHENFEKTTPSLKLQREGSFELSPQVQESFVSQAVTQYNQRSFQNPVMQMESSAQTLEPLSVHQHHPKETPRHEPAPAPQSLPPMPAKQKNWSSLQVIGQYANTYIVCQSQKGLVLVDQHAAHERVLFERLKLSHGSKGMIEKQGALLEELLELPRENIEALTDERYASIFDSLGFEIFDRGPNTLAVAARPAFLTDVGLQPLFERLSEQLMDSGSRAVLDDVVTDIWASMSCHGAIRAGRVLSHDEMHALLLQMDEFAFSSFCPHGRPVSVQWSLHELERLFKRIV